MYKIILTIVLATISNPTMADWIPVKDHNSYYVSYDGMTQIGNVIKMMILINGEKDSGVSIVEYNCKTEIAESKRMALHDQNMGKGKITGVVDDNDGLSTGRDLVVIMGEHFKTACKMFYDNKVKEEAKFLDDVEALRKKGAIMRAWQYLFGY